jgi:hypothetical protein
MAQFPCEADGARYLGPQSTYYIGIVKGVKSIRARRRFCPTHYDQVHQRLEAAELATAQQPYPMDCFEPGCSTYADWAVFGTGYAQGGEREDNYARGCDVHIWLLASEVLGVVVGPQDAA